jgi:RimJ/RimL family protein N-acetyltransferase
MTTVISTAGRSLRASEATQPPDGLPVYRVLTGPDDATFCRRVSDAVLLGYQLQGSPALTFNNERVIVAQALVWPESSPIESGSQSLNQCDTGSRLSPQYPITTSRLRLSPLTIDDLDEALTYRSREDVCRYLPFEPQTRERLLTRLTGDLSRTEITAEGQSLTLGARLAETGSLIGDVVLFFHSEKHSAGELGYVFSPEAQGRGYATEACAAVLALAFEQLSLHRVIAQLDARNEPSARLAERLGMRREAHLHHDEMFKGEWSDRFIYAMLHGEWPGSPGQRLAALTD